MTCVGKTHGTNSSLKSVMPLSLKFLTGKGPPDHKFSVPFVTFRKQLIQAVCTQNIILIFLYQFHHVLVQWTPPSFYHLLLGAFCSWGCTDRHFSCLLHLWSLFITDILLSPKLQHFHSIHGDIWSGALWNLSPWHSQWCSSWQLYPETYTTLQMILFFFGSCNSHALPLSICWCMCLRAIDLSNQHF